MLPSTWSNEIPFFTSSHKSRPQNRIKIIAPFTCGGAKEILAKDREASRIIPGSKRKKNLTEVFHIKKWLNATKQDKWLTAALRKGGGEIPKPGGPRKEKLPAGHKRMGAAKAIIEPAIIRLSAPFPLNPKRTFLFIRKKRGRQTRGGLQKGDKLGNREEAGLVGWWGKFFSLPSMAFPDGRFVS